jgi:hypothetical protein
MGIELERNMKVGVPGARDVEDLREAACARKQKKPPAR